MVSELILTRGLPASGKSTWAKLQVLQGKADARFNRDDFRKMMFQLEGVGNITQENAVTKALQASVVTLISQRNRKVIVDDVNLRLKTVSEWKRIADIHGATLRVQDFNTPLKECIARDKKRERSVGEDVIKAFNKKYLNNTNTFPTLPASTWERPKKVEYVENKKLPATWIFDIDGTLAQMHNRGPFDWHKVGDDHPVPYTIELAQMLHENGKQIIIFTGREEVCQSETVEWLNGYDIPFDAIYMRAEGDSRKDNHVKKELYETYIQGKYYVEGIVDDRLQVVKMWHEMGLPVFRVGHPESAF